MSPAKDPNAKLYYYIDVNLQTKQIIGWGIERRDEMEVHLTDGFHRLFISKGQYNKLTEKL